MCFSSKNLNCLRALFQTFEQIEQIITYCSAVLRALSISSHYLAVPFSKRNNRKAQRATDRCAITHLESTLAWYLGGGGRSIKSSKPAQKPAPISSKTLSTNRIRRPLWGLNNLFTGFPKTIRKQIYTLQYTTVAILQL